MGEVWFSFFSCVSFHDSVLYTSFSMYSFYLYSYIFPIIMYCLRHLLLFTCKQGCFVSMTSLFLLWKPMYLQSVLFEFGVLNLKEIHSPIHL